MIRTEQRNQLLETLQDAELVDNLKVQIRQRLLQKLKNSRKSPDASQIKPQRQLVKRLAASLFMDFLQQNNMDYSLSVFVPESGYSQNFFQRQELSELLKIPRVNEQKEIRSLFQTLLEERIPRTNKQTSSYSSATQTDDPGSVESVETKLMMIDYAYRQKLADPSMLQMQESRLESEAKYKMELDKRYRNELQRQIKRIREYQVATALIEERQKFSIQMKEYREELQLKYKERMVKLREKEEELVKRVTQKMKEIEDYSHQHRQKVLKDIEYVKQKERELEILSKQLEQRERTLTKRM